MSMNIKPSTVALIAGVGIAAYLIWRNISTTPKKQHKELDIDNNFMNAIGKSARTASKEMSLKQLFSKKGSNVCPPQCD